MKRKRTVALYGLVIGGLLALGAQPGWACDAHEKAGAGAGVAVADAPDLTAVELPNRRLPRPGVVTGGQPSPEQLVQAAKAGVKVVVNLRGDGEPMVEETGQIAKKLGLMYVRIPLSGSQPDFGLTEQNARKLGKLLAHAKDRPLLVHCASGNRVGALMALEAFYVEGKSAAEALAEGRKAGLTRLEPVVRRILERAETQRKAKSAK